jgi:DNA replication protein DnaC
VKLSRALLNRSCVPTAYFNVQFSKIPSVCPHKVVVQNYLKKLTTNIDKGLGLYLWGDYSTGKSAIGCILLKAALSKKIVGYWCRSSNIASDVIGDRTFDATMSIHDRLLSAPILVIDELVCHDDRRDAYVENVIRERVNEGYATIVTSNYSPTKLGKKYPALAEVLKESVVPVQVRGHDFRGEIAESHRKEVL